MTTNTSTDDTTADLVDLLDALTATDPTADALTVINAAEVAAFELADWVPSG